MTELATKRPRLSHLMWIPAALMVAAAALSILGMSLVPHATAATDTKNITVTATVGVAVWGAQGCSGSVAYGTTLTTGLDDTALGTCAFTFGTNSTTTTATLTLKTAASGGTTPFFCGTAGCTGSGANQGKFADSGANVADLDDGAFGFGQALAGHASNCTSALTLGRKSPLDSTGVLACTQTAPARNLGNDGSFTATFYADPGTMNAAGNYKGTLDSVATAT